MKIRNLLPETGVGHRGKKEELESNKSGFDFFFFSILFPGLDNFLALAGCRCRTKVSHPPPNLPKWQNYHGVKPPA